MVAQARYRRRTIRARALKGLRGNQRTKQQAREPITVREKSTRKERQYHTHHHIHIHIQQGTIPAAPPPGRPTRRPEPPADPSPADGDMNNAMLKSMMVMLEANRAM